jgi:flagellar biosynthesis anti-sigma factor FlgM
MTDIVHGTQMKIDQGELNPISAQRPESLQEKPEAQAVDTGQRAQAKDRADLSRDALTLAKARVRLNETSDVRQERIAALQAQVQAGTYRVPVEELAKALLSHWKRTDIG